MIFNAANMRELLLKIEKVKDLYSTHDLIKNNLTEKELNNILFGLVEFDECVRDSDVLIRDYESFIKNDLHLLCLLSDNKVEKYKAAKFVLKEQNLPHGGDRPKELLFKIESELKKKFSVDQFNVAA